MYKFDLDKHDKSSARFLSYVLSDADALCLKQFPIWSFIANQYNVTSRALPFSDESANDKELKMNYDLTEEKLNKYIALYLLTKND